MQSYIQTTGDTTAAASLMAIINHFRPDYKLTKENEFLIWRSAANLPILAPSIYGLASFARRQGLKPRIVLGNKDFYYPNYRFMGYRKKQIDHAKFSSDLYRKEAIDLDIHIEERDFEFKEVQELVDKGDVVLLRVNEGALRNKKSVAKYIVVFGHEHGKFLIVDPHLGIMKVDKKMLEEAFDTLESKNKRDHRMIVFE